MPTIGKSAVTGSPSTLTWPTSYRDKEAKLRTFDIRYEDLRRQPLPILVDLMAFLLPEKDLPSIERVGCAIEKRPTAYKSRKTPIFDAWDRYEPSTRDWLLREVKDVWCKFGYDQMLKEERGIESPVRCKS
jgi:hypothetical protein